MIVNYDPKSFIVQATDVQRLSDEVDTSLVKSQLIYWQQTIEL